MYFLGGCSVLGIILSVIALYTTAAILPAFAQSSFIYDHGTFIPLNVPGSDSTQAYSINESGSVVGYYSSQNAGHGFAYISGQFSTVPVPGAVTASGLNNFGQIVGTYNQQGGGQSGYLYNNGAIVDGLPSGLVRINDSGAILGSDFLRSGNQTTPISFPSALASTAWGLNNLGQIVGNYYDGTTAHGFYYDGSSYQTIDFAGAGRTELFGLNDLGQMVGQAYFGQSGSAQFQSQSGFLYSGGIFTMIADPLASRTIPFGINNEGVIVGFEFNNINGVPEPSTWAMLLIGFAGMGLLARSRSRRDRATCT
jgi:hypothetical protein